MGGCATFARACAHPVAEQADGGGVGTYSVGQRARGAGCAYAHCGEARELEHLLARPSLRDLASNPPLD